MEENIVRKSNALLDETRLKNSVGSRIYKNHEITGIHRLAKLIHLEF